MVWNMRDALGDQGSGSGCDLEVVIELDTETVDRLLLLLDRRGFAGLQEDTGETELRA